MNYILYFKKKVLPMENDEIQNNEIFNEIGYIARQIDTEMTIFERMKITKSTMQRVLMALGIYLITMVILIFIL